MQLPWLDGTQEGRPISPNRSEHYRDLICWRGEIARNEARLYKSRKNLTVHNSAILRAVVRCLHPPAAAATARRGRPRVLQSNARRRQRLHGQARRAGRALRGDGACTAPKMPPRRPSPASPGVHPPPHGLCRCAAQSVPPACPLPPILQSHPLPCSLCACTAVGRRLPPAGATARPAPSGLLATLGAGRAHAGGGSPPYISQHLPISPRSST